MSEDYVEINGVRYRRVDPAEPQRQNISQLKSRGEILMEAANTAPVGKSIISGLPSGIEHHPMNPYSTLCTACSHPLVEVNCPQHGSGGDYVGISPAEYFHRKCLEQALEERKRQMLTEVDTEGLRRIR